MADSVSGLVIFKLSGLTKYAKKQQELRGTTELGDDSRQV